MGRIIWTKGNDLLQEDANLLSLIKPNGERYA